MDVEPKNKSFVKYHRCHSCDTDFMSVCICVDEIQPTDVGLTPKMPCFSPPLAGRAPTITYLHIHECEKFSVHTALLKCFYFW